MSAFYKAINYRHLYKKKVT